MVHSGITPEWILTRIAMQLGVEDPAADRLALLKQLYDRLLEIEASGRRAVVLIDEAQMLQTRELMEEFRGLLNLEIPGKKLLNIVFFGLTEVEDCLQLDEPLAQRVAVKYHLGSLTVRTTEAYIKHRLQVAGAKRMIFSHEAIPAIHRYAGGVPRLINTICDNCLFEAYLQKLNEVQPRIVHSVAGDLGLLRQPLPGVDQQEQQGELDEIESMLERLEQK
jgi:type II secretory pathway predicted ATPase ExeA